MAYRDMTDEELREIAAKRVNAKKEFRSHVIVYLLVNAFLVVIYFVNSPGGHFWPIYPIAGWGVGLFFHGLDLRSKLSKSTADEIEDEIERLKRM